MVTLNEPQKPATDFASADAGEPTVDAAANVTGAGGAGQESKSVPALLSDARDVLPSSSRLSPSSSAVHQSKTHYDNPAGSNSEKRDNAQGGISSTITPTQSLNIRGVSSNTSSNRISKEINNQIQNSVANNPSSSSNLSSYSKPTEQNTQSQKPPLSRSICISNLVRPFTLPALKSKLVDFGDMDFFWINSIKSHCFVTVSHTLSIDLAII